MSGAARASPGRGGGDGGAPLPTPPPRRVLFRFLPLSPSLHPSPLRRSPPPRTLHSSLTFTSHRTPHGANAQHNTSLCLLEVAHTIASGSSAATSIRVGFHLGRNSPRGARLAGAVGGALGSAVAVAGLVALFLARESLGRVFSDDPAVVSGTAGIAAPLGITFVAWSAGEQAWGTLDGQGRPAAAGASFFAGGYVVALPLAGALWATTSLGLAGLWWALAAGYIVAASAAWLAVARSDWPALAAAAQAAAAAEGEVAKAEAADAATAA